MKRELLDNYNKEVPDRPKYTVRCPECGKESHTDRPPTRSRGGDFETFFCSLKCEKNYRYRQRTRNIWTQEIKDPDEVSKW